MSDATRLNRTASWLKDFLVLWAVGIAIFTSIASAFFYFARNEIADFAWVFLGMERLATAEQVAELRAQVDRLSGKLDEVTGEDGLVIVNRAQSFVLEPVRQGELVTVRYLMRRTQRGMACTFVGSTPMFADMRDIRFPGETVTPPVQVSRQFERRQVTYKAPSNLLPGRIELTVALEYDCKGQRSFDEIDALTFQLLPAD